MSSNIIGINKQNLNSSTYLEEPQGQLKAHLFDLQQVCIHPQAANKETNYSHPLSTQSNIFYSNIHHLQEHRTEYLFYVQFGVFSESQYKLSPDTSIDKEHPCSIFYCFSEIKFAHRLSISYSLPDSHWIRKLLGRITYTGKKDSGSNTHKLFFFSAGLLLILDTFSLARTIRFSSRFHWNAPSLNSTCTRGRGDEVSTTNHNMV